MKVSTQEVERIKRVGSSDSMGGEMSTSSIAHIMESSTASDVILQVASIVESTPEVREDVIAAIKARTSNGTYRVTSDEIADQILRRALADNVR